MSKENLNQLAREYTRGDKTRGHAIISAMLPALASLWRRRGIPISQRDDLTQEACIKILRFAERFSTGNFRVGALQIARWTIISERYKSTPVRYPTSARAWTAVHKCLRGEPDWATGLPERYVQFVSQYTQAPVWLDKPLSTGDSWHEILPGDVPSDERAFCRELCTASNMTMDEFEALQAWLSDQPVSHRKTTVHARRQRALTKLRKAARRVAREA